VFLISKQHVGMMTILYKLDSNNKKLEKISEFNEYVKPVYTDKIK